MKCSAERRGRASGLEILLLAISSFGCAFLVWIWLIAEPPVSAAPKAAREQVAVPSFSFFTREDGMPVAKVDPEAFAKFLSSFGIPPLDAPPPAIEAAVAKSLHRAMQALAERGAAEDYGRLGQLFDAFRMMDQCHACFDAAVRLAPDEHRWRHYLGRDLATRGEFAEAEAQLRRAIAIQPSYLPTHWRLARLCAQQERTDEADAILRSTLDKSPNPYPWTELAFLELERARFPEARTLLEEALKRDPLNGRAHALMSQTLAALGETTQAEAHARKGRYSVKSLDPIPDPIVRDGLRETDSVAYHRIAARFASSATGAEKIALWENICSADPANADDKIQLANAYFEAGKLDDAIATLDAAMAQEPRGARFRLARAQLAVRMEDYASALRFAGEATELEQAPVTALLVQSLALTSMGREEEAVAPAERAMALSPDNPDMYAFLASAYVSVRRFDDALATYERGLAVDPESPSLRAGLAALEKQAPKKN